jgi:hypothetical protein
MIKQTFDPIWRRIVRCEGQHFKTVTGLPFTYSIHGQTLRPSRARYNLPRSGFEKAWELLPKANRSQLNRAAHGPSYVVAIQTDPRIAG